MNASVELTHDRLSRRIDRARLLANERPATADVLTFYADLAVFQQSLLREQTAVLRSPHQAAFADALNAPAAATLMSGLLAWLDGIRLPVVMVLHANHANEIDADVRAACAALKSRGLTLVNQSVLLRGVNDDVDTLLDPYAAEAPEEYFAVASEAFFVSPLDLKHEQPAMYRLLAGYYRQDPAAAPDAAR